MLDIQSCGPETKSMNEYTNNEVNKRKLQFNSDKCHRMHIGNDLNHCEDIYISDWSVKKTGSQLLDQYDGKMMIDTVKHQLYLGDIISHDGSNRKNIDARVSKGNGIVRDIMMILNSPTRRHTLGERRSTNFLSAY